MFVLDLCFSFSYSSCQWAENYQLHLRLYYDSHGKEAITQPCITEGNRWSYMLMFMCFGGKKYFHMKTIKGSCLLRKENPTEGNCWVKKIQGREIIVKGISQ